MEKNKDIRSYQEVMENGINNWVEKIPNPFSIGNTPKYGYLVAADALREAIKTFGTYNRNMGGVSYHEIIFSNPIQPGEAEWLGGQIDSIKVDYWGYILFCHNGSAGGSKTPRGDQMKVAMNHIVETIDARDAVEEQS